MTDAQNPGGEDWAGEMGDRWLAQVDRFEQMLRPLGLALLDHAKLQAGENILDVGCGGGWTSREAALRVGAGGRVCGVDISAALVKEAARRATDAGLRNVWFEAGDAAELEPEGTPFDQLMSRLGIMFFADPAAAFANLHSLMAKGGSADMAVWAPPQDNVWIGGVLGIVAAHIPMPPPDPLAPGPFSLADPKRFAALLEQAGFREITFTPWVGSVMVGGDQSSAETAVDFLLGTFPFADDKESIPPETLRAIREELIALYKPFETPAGIAAQGKAWLVTAIA
ncbi:class I SAM-dependent methyltransferase [Sphingomonas sp. MMS24-J13]|uniref:class I SAM-dependent methyltransferase n=1 Tax=Sphingomonas sp. MMS24-J13 TaxID=3238686 RepID=UPI00384F14F3